jgi:UDP-N-acetylglucosamine--N-acetylmuramyl-(pentapeptide) pyrophosphoryl-undecaprenol N-acetylglucosamine transferase
VLAQLAEEQDMKIVVTGGGSGGHITPLLAVAHELKEQRQDLEIIYIGQKGDGLADIPAQDPNIDRTKLVFAGKFRRYHGEGLRQLLDIPTMLKNVRDAVLVLVGLWQCFFLLKKLRPDVIFIKGGFVGVPVGLAAAVLRIPYITHDSDALPGLANRIVAPWAKLHTVALPKEIYNYPPDKTEVVGVPLSHHYRPYTTTEVKAAKEQITGSSQGRMLLVTGGGLGAKRINDAVATCASELLNRYPDLTIVQIAGRNLEAKLRQLYKQKLSPEHQKRVIIMGYITNLYTYSSAADVVITRAGATSIAELAAQQKACIVVPNPILAGGHQLKNAQVLADRAAVKLLAEDKLKRDQHALMPPLVDLLDNPERAKRLGKTLGSLSEPNSAKHLAMLLLEQAA